MESSIRDIFFFFVKLSWGYVQKNWRLGAKKNQILTVAHIVSLKLIQWSSHSPWLHLCAIYGVPWIPSRLTPVMLAFFDQHLPDITSLFVTQNHPIESREPTTFIQLDGKILTGKPDQFDGKLTIPLIFRLRFSQQNQSIETWNNGRWIRWAHPGHRRQPRDLRVVLCLGHSSAGRGGLAGTAGGGTAAPWEAKRNAAAVQSGILPKGGENLWNIYGKSRENLGKI